MKNKGFTLVELLGVLVIIVVVSLIVTPIVYTNIENVRLQANKRNTDKLIKTALDYYEKNTMKNEKNYELIIECDGSKCFYENNQSEELTFSGAKPKGHITISKYGEVLQADLLFDRYVCSYIDEKIECKKLDLIIDNITDFNTFLSKVDEYDNKTVVLSSDLDYNNKTFTPTSKTFKGEFNALGYSISNINYEGAYHGIFHTIDGATIKSLKVEKSEFVIAGNYGNIGIIAGVVKNKSKIYNCYSIDNIIKAKDDSIYMPNTGGLFGYVINSYIDGCVGERLTIIGISSDYRDNCYGGLIGQASSNSIISNSNVLDSYLSGGRFIGGLVGKLEGEINNSYSKNVILNGRDIVIGGIIGSVFRTSTIKNSYVSYDCSNNQIINRIKENSVDVDINIPNDLAGNINAGGQIAAGIVGYCDTNTSLAVNNVYSKNVVLTSSDSSLTGYLIGNINNISGSVNAVFDNVYALSIDASFLGKISNTTTTDTIIFNYEGTISYPTGNNAITYQAWKNNLDKNWNTTSSKYPLLYKIDKNGNPTSYLLGGQE